MVHFFSNDSVLSVLSFILIQKVAMFLVASYSYGIIHDMVLLPC